MNKKLIAVVSLVGMMAGGSVLAGGMMRDGGCGGMGDSGYGMGNGGHSMHGGHGMAMHQLDRLDLTAEQEAKVQKIMDEQKQAGQDRMKAMRDTMDAMHKAMDGDNYDARKVRELADKQAKLQADMMVEHAETMHRIRAVLTPEQKKQLDAMKAKMKERMERRMEGRKGSSDKK